MAGGRPPRGADLVDGCTGSREAKRRMKAILQTLAGKLQVREAAPGLGMCESAFYKLRDRTLQEAVEGLEVRPSGPRPAEVSEADRRVEELEAQVVELERELKAARVREELAAAFPRLAKKSSKGKKGR